MTVDVVDGTALPPVDALTGYSSIVLVDVDAAALSPDQVAALSLATRDLGRGLVTIGGTQSYALGGYLGSELEQILPVVSDILDPQRRQSVAEVLAIDTSGSMGACHCAEGSNGMPAAGNRSMGGINKTDISASRRRPGHRGAVGARRDRRAGGQHVRAVGDRPAAAPRRGGRHVRPALAAPHRQRHRPQPLAVRVRRRRCGSRTPRLKHIILFTDGFTDVPVLTDLAEEAAALREEGITVSVLATGEGSAGELAAVAEAGGGRFYPGRNLEEIPQIMQQEATIASRDFVNEGEFLPTITSSAEVVAGLEATPPLARLRRHHGQAPGHRAPAHRPRPGPAAGLVERRPRAGHVVDQRRRRPLGGRVGVVGGLRRLLDPGGEGHLPAAPPARAG